MGNFLESIKNRRTIYKLNNTIKVSDNQIEECIKQSLLNSPTAFNSQSSRVVLLLNDNHHKLWNITKETLRKIVPPEAFQTTSDKLDSFDAAYGTMLFFDETTITKNLMEAYPSYKDNFPVWAEQSNGMLQLVIWTALSDLSLGASLQHYNPIIDDEVKKTFNLPSSWKLISQMPFGNRYGEPDEKTFEPIEKRFISLK